MISFELRSEFGDGLSTGEGQGVGWEEVWPEETLGEHSSPPPLSFPPPPHAPLSLLPSLLFFLLDMLSSHRNFDHPEMNRGVSPQQASPGGTCWLMFRHQANLTGFYGKLAQRWMRAHWRSHSLPVLAPGGTAGGGGIRFRAGTPGLWGV